MRSFWALLLTAGLMTIGAGCVAPPRVFHPGSVQQQQARAQRFDPFPENDLGPAVVGARPREYSNPEPEVLRVQPRRGVAPLAPCPTGPAIQ